MPSKRTNDSVDRILEELSHEQAEQGVRDSVTDRQVDAILQSMGLDSRSSASAHSGVSLGPIQKEDLPKIKLNAADITATTDRFSTTILDDLLGDLPSLRAAKAGRAPRPAAPSPRRRPAVQDIQNVESEQTVQPEETPRPQPAPQPQPEARPARTAPQPSQPEPQQPAPEQPEPEQPARTGELGDTTRTGIIKDFLKKMVPTDESNDQRALNRGKQQFQDFFGESAAVLPDEKGRLVDPSKKKKRFGLGSAADTGAFVPISLLGDADTQDAGREPEPEPEHAAPRKPGLLARLFGGTARREAPQPEPEEPQAAAPTEALPTEAETYPDSGTAQESLEFSLPSATQAGIRLSDGTLSMPRQDTAPAEPARTESRQQTSTIYRKKRDTVEFLPRKHRRGRTVTEAEPQPRPTEPVGEPVMTSNAQLPPEPMPEPEPVREPAEQPERRSAAPVPEDTFENLAPEVVQTMTGQVRLTEIASGAAQASAAPQPAPAASPAEDEPEEEENFDALLDTPVEEKPNTAEFVWEIAQSINGPRPAAAGGTAPRKAEPSAKPERFQNAAQYLSDIQAENDAVEKQEKAEKARRRTRLTGRPADEKNADAEAPFDEKAEAPRRREYESADDAPAVRQELEQRVLFQTITAIVCGAAALVLVWLGTSAVSGTPPMPAALDPAADPAPLLITTLILLIAACAASWQTLLNGVLGFLGHRRGSAVDSMPTLAALGAVLQCLVFLFKPEWYSANRLCLLAGPAALLLCGNAAGKALDARTVRENFRLVSAGVDHAVAHRIKDISVLHTVTAGLAEPRPNVLVSRPTRLLKGFLAGSDSRRTSDKNQQQFARMLALCALAAFVFTLFYQKSPGMAFTVLASVLCFGTPLAGTLISALPMWLMQRSAAQIGAVVPGWKDIRILGQINVLQVTAQDLFPKGCITLGGIRAIPKGEIESAIVDSASLLDLSNSPLKNAFLEMTGNNRKLLKKVTNFETIYGMGYLGWIEDKRVLFGSRRLMERYEVKVPSMEYERRHTVNQRRMIYLAVSGELRGMFQVAYQSDPDTAAVLDTLQKANISLIVDCDDFNCDETLLQTAYNLSAGTVKVLSGKEREALNPAVAWLPESEGNMLHLGSFASFVGGLEAAAGAAEGEHKASMVLSASVLISCVLAVIMVLAGGLAGLPLPVMVLYQIAWAVMAMIFPMLQRY